MTDARFRRGTADMAQARETADLIANSQISVYPISLLGLEEAGIPSSSSGISSVSPLGGPWGSTAHPQMGDTNQNQFSARSDLRFAANDLADQTGGEAFVGTNDFAGALRRSMLDGANYYTIAYRPSNDKWNGQFRKIHVELVGRSGSLDYRHGYYADPDTHPQADSVRDLHVAMQPATPESTMLGLQLPCAATQRAASQCERRFGSRSLQRGFHNDSRWQAPRAFSGSAYRPERRRATGGRAPADLWRAESRSDAGSIQDRRNFWSPAAPGTDSQAGEIPPPSWRQRLVYAQSRHHRHARGDWAGQRREALAPADKLASPRLFRVNGREQQPSGCLINPQNMKRLQPRALSSYAFDATSSSALAIKTHCRFVIA